MNRRRVMLREALVSAVINAVLSLLFFLGLLGLSHPIAWSALALDGLPQTFMVALMGSLVPVLLVGAKLGRARGPIVARAMLFGAGALLLLGGGGWLLLHDRSGMVAAAPALAAKVAYGAVLGAIVTPFALSFLFKDPTA